MDAVQHRIHQLEAQAEAHEQAAQQWTVALQQMQGQLQQQQQQAAAQQGGAAAQQQQPRTIMRPDEFKGRPEDDWMTFRRHFERIVLLNEWNLHRAGLALQVVMKEDAARATTDIDISNCTSIGECLDLFEARFLPPSASQMARVRFDQAHQTAQEKELAFHARARALYARAYPTSNDDTPLIRKFTLGLRDPRIKEQVLRKNPATYAAALEAAQAEQSIVEVSAHLTLGVETAPTTPTTPTQATPAAAAAPERMEIGAIGGGDSRQIECWLCKEKGHRRTDCPLYQRAIDQYRSEMQRRNNRNYSRGGRGRGGGGGYRNGGGSYRGGGGDYQNRAAAEYVQAGQQGRAAAQQGYQGRVNAMEENLQQQEDFQNADL